MKYLKDYKLFESVNEKEIHDICKEYGIENYTINRDGSIDVSHNVFFYFKKITKLPLKFNRVLGDFDCFNSQLTSLEGCPVIVGGNFNCSLNQLTSLEGGPHSVGGYFKCSSNKLNDLKGFPKHLGGYFDCRNNNLISLEGLEFKSFGKIYLENNPIYPVVNHWIEYHKELIEYFIEMNPIQVVDGKPSLIIQRLEAFYEDTGLEMKPGVDIDLNWVKEYLKIID